jgi:hypothetical protein
MHALLIKEEVGIPTIINEDSHDFPTLLLSGYEIVTEGTKKQCEEVEAAMLEEFKIY